MPAPRLNQYRAAVLFVAAAFLCVPVQSAPAQSIDWMGAAKNILNSTTTGARTGTNTGADTLSQGDIATGLREALRVGTNAVVKRLGVINGFNLDPKVHIPLPKTLQRVDGALSAIGMASVGDDLELRLNRAAEAATPRAKELFIAAIQKMTIDDARKILSADPTAATQYLRRTMGAELARDMTPVVASSMAQVGAIGAYDRMAANYKSIPVVGAAIPDGKAQMTKYVVDRAMDGIFYYVGQEEAAIRANPAKRTTDILKKVFGIV
jgi:hypothetical protein